MDGHDYGVAGLSEAGATDASDFDRYAHWPKRLAKVALALLIVMLLLAAWAPGMRAGPKEVPFATVDSSPSGADNSNTGKEVKEDEDLKLYRLIIERVERGDSYYAAAVEEQRRNNYPVYPGFTVRLPTLAYAVVWLGPIGVAIVAVLLLAAVIISVFRRLGQEPGGMRFRLMALTLLFVGMATGLQFKYHTLHEVWAAELLALSFGLHRPLQGKWLGAWLAAAAALAIREHALPFVLLMATFAGWRQNWRECAAWIGLVVMFGVGLAYHLHLAEAQVHPGDPVSPSWLVLGGLQGWLYKVINSSSLSMLPVVLAGPLVVLSAFGWTGWRTPAGDFATLLTLGYGLAFMIAGRDNNFYWGIVITPILFMGLAFAPWALQSLWNRALEKRAGAPALG
jgi:hypothetical protein